MEREMPYHKKLLGFNIKIDPESPIMYWDSYRRDQYLLHPTIDYPLSIDSHVWACVIDNPDYPDAFAGFDFWRDLEDMKAMFLRQRSHESLTGVAIAMLLVWEKPEDIIALRARFEYLDLPIDMLPDDWLFLGYDIVDIGCLSGLSNCGYYPDEKIELQKIWVNRLNENGLMKKAEHALEFREITDIRVPEHAPFYVIGLYRDPQLLRTE
jgi:hypothetical protein